MMVPLRKLVIEPGREPLMNMWHVGYMVGDKLFVWAGGVSEKSLQAVIEAERRRIPTLEIEDRR